jgi:Tol biopolymer transport system component
MGTQPRRTPPPQAGARRLPFPVAPALSIVGLAIVALVSVGLLGGPFPSILGTGPGGPFRTPTPSNVVVVDPRADVPGSVLYVKDGNVWRQAGDEARQLTAGGLDSMPTWSPDGSAIYFVRNQRETGRWPSGGDIREYHLSVPSLTRFNADGTGQPTTLLTGRVKRGDNTWSYFIRQPAISPDGSQAVVVTDGPDPTRSDVVVKLLDLATGELTDPKLAQSSALGHGDPVWAPDGGSFLYVRNAREGTRGTPAIYRYDMTTKKSTALTGPGYMSPSWSRDGRYVAATKTSNFGTDIVVLDGRTGAELLRLTRDERSFNPVWSPIGNAIAFQRVEHGVVDLYLLPLEGTAPDWAVGEPLALTISAGLDAGSRPAWFIPPDQLPPLPRPTAVPASSGETPTAP